MKKTLKLMAMLLCVVSLTSLSSCSKDIDDENGNETSMQIGNYTLGKYHPAKKISSLRFVSSGIGGYGAEEILYTFSWDGNNIDKIVKKDKYGEISYKYYYGDNGYITKIEDGEGRIYAVGYWKDKVLLFGTSDFDWEYGSPYSMGFEFDNNGTPVKILGTGVVGDGVRDELNMVDGNPTNITYSNSYGSHTLTFDNHPNPLKDLIIPPSLCGRIVGVCLISKNNLEYLWRSSTPSITYEGDEEYPSSNNSLYPIGILINYGCALEIEYLN